ncbi:hypothetical protein HPB48_007901 [Haemaphysalis longicornis]|uniref:Uncharacterized protein n=1 Tax=Haemaphysalis longicornis TaxID=44386 RepID=A0A9J6FXG9_HAELO|nr:hypothetical protein HPB48_007901 [Haemaphysalis longicornis]
MLAYVRNLNPFKDPMEWTEIASKMQELLQQPFTARAVRDRTELLLRQYASADRTNLRSQADPASQALSVNQVPMTTEPAGTPSTSRLPDPAASLGPTPTRNEVVRGRRRNDQEARYEFFEKRMRHEITMEKEAAIESKRIALEEKRLQLEKDAAERELRVAQEMRKQMEEMRQHMAEERAIERAEERRLRAEEREIERSERPEVRKSLPRNYRKANSK